MKRLLRTKENHFLSETFGWQIPVIHTNNDNLTVTRTWKSHLCRSFTYTNIHTQFIVKEIDNIHDNFYSRVVIEVEVKRVILGTTLWTEDQKRYTNE